MALPEAVHDLELHYEFPDREQTIHPVAVETDDGVILVDVGLPDSTDRIADRLEAAGLALSDVEHVLATHHDGDHVGSLASVVDRTGATVFAHVDEAPYVDGREDPVKGDPDDRPTPVPVDVEVVEGVRFRTEAGPMDVVETPGHTPGHVSLYFPDADFLVAADATAAEDGDLTGYVERFTPDEATATDSIGHLADLDVTTTLCYHGGLVEHDADRLGELYEELSR